MILVVDAYNLLRAALFSKKKITDKERAAFIAQLALYGKKKRHKMVVVFDGGPYEWPYKEPNKDILVVYSGINQCADSFIKEYLQAHREKDLLLVSSDNELNRYAAHLSIASIDSLVFFDRFKQFFLNAADQQHAGHGEGVVARAHAASQPHIDELMLQASKVVPVKSEDYVQNVDRSKKNKIGKKERMLLKKLSKL